MGLQCIHALFVALKEGEGRAGSYQSLHMARRSLQQNQCPREAEKLSGDNPYVVQR